MPSVALLNVIMNSNRVWRILLSNGEFSGTFVCRQFLLLSVFIVCSVSLTGCAGITTSQTVPNLAAQEDGKDVQWRSRKEWLLSRLPKAEHLAQDILLVLHDNPDKTVCISDNTDAGCNKLLVLLSQRLSQYKVQMLPEGLGCFAIIAADTAYVFRMSDWTFTGIADLSGAFVFCLLL